MTTKMTALEAVAAVENAVAMAQYESRWTEDDGAEHSAGLAALRSFIAAHKGERVSMWTTPKAVEQLRYMEFSGAGYIDAHFYARKTPLNTEQVEIVIHDQEEAL